MTQAERSKMRRSVPLLRSVSLHQPLGSRSEHATRFPARRTVVIEGNIASGKTECLQHLSSHPSIQTVAEPVDKWRNVQGHNALDLMYKDPARWSLTLQTYVQLTMMQAHTNPQIRPIKVMERSIFSAKYCFVENLKAAGLMPPVEFAVLSEWFDWLMDNWRIDVDLIIYLRTKPEVVLQRLKKRHRSEELAVSLDYLSKLHTLHEDWLIDRRFTVPCEVVVTLFIQLHSLCSGALWVGGMKDPPFRNDGGSKAVQTIDANGDLDQVQAQCEQEIIKRFCSISAPVEPSRKATAGS